MKQKLGLLIGAALLVNSGQLSAIEIDVGSIPQDNIGVEINPNDDTFAFRANAEGHSFFINIVNNGAEDSVGLRGHVTGTFQIGSISPWVDDPSFEHAPVASSQGAQLIVFDGPTPFVADINWVDIVSDDNNQYLNIVEAAINLKNITYAGTKQDLRALAGGGEAYAILSFTTHKTLTQLTSGSEPTITSFNGDFWAETYGSLGDFVWEDLNRDGIQDVDVEAGIPGATVNLYLGSSTVPYRTTTTDATGKYLFDFLAENTYSVEVLPPGGYVATLAEQGSDDSKDSNLNPTTVSLGLAESNLTIDFGFYRPAALGDFVWHDVNGNGIQEDSEPGIGGVIVNLLDEAGDPLDTRTTSVSGYYLFSNLVPGTYSVEFSTPAGYTPTGQNVGADDSKDSDSNPLTGKTGTYVLVSGESNLTVDAGFVAIPPPPCDPTWTFTKVALTPTVQVGGLGSYKYVVKNTTDCGEITGVVIVDDNGTPSDPSDDFTVTPPGGATIPPLGEVEYVVNNVSLPFEVCGPPTADGDDSAGLLYSEVLPGGNIKVTFIQSFNRNDNTYGINSIGWKSNRPHRFRDLLNSDQVTFSVRDATGKEVLRFQQDYISKTSGGYASLGATGGDGKMIVGSATHFDPTGFGSSLAENLAKPQFSDPDFLINSPEFPNPDWEFYMIYSFIVKPSAFPAGFGGVTVVDQHNSPPKSGAESFPPKPCNPCIVNVATATGYHNGVPLTPLTASAQVCVGTPAPPTASLGDRVWVDVNKNGKQDDEDSEPGLSGVTVKLLTCSGTLVKTTTSGAYGQYLFTGLTPGVSYKVQFVLPTGYAFTVADAASAGDQLDSDANVSTGLTPCVTLAAGELNRTVDAGVYLKGTTSSGPGTGTPGYWMNHPLAWPCKDITIGGIKYPRDAAIKYMKAPVKSDKTYNMFAQLVATKLNILIGNASSCLTSVPYGGTTVNVLTLADDWMKRHNVGSGVRASSSAWLTGEYGELIHEYLDDYNNGQLCAPPRD